MALNRALIKHQWEFHALKGNCVFISHKKEDETAAIAIGNYLTEQIGVDIYLDLYDMELKEAVSVENDKKIVESIKKGITSSTHLLCLVSDKTRLSWWVPYEVGVAGEHQKQIATLKLKGVEDIPSFLKTERVLKSMREFFEYTKSYQPYNGMLSKREFALNDYQKLHNYIDY